MNYKTIYNNPVERSKITYPFTWWDDAFTDENINEITQKLSGTETKRASVLGENINIDKVRRCDVGFHYRNQDNFWIFNNLNQVVENLNNQFYGFDLNGYDTFQYTVYNAEENGTYDWHVDMCFGKTAPEQMIEPRKLSLTMLLNEPGVDFEGGDFQISLGSDEEIETVQLKKGRIIAFPSFILHRVTPVTKGVRKSIVIWVTGPKFK